MLIPRRITPVMTNEVLQVGVICITDCILEGVVSGTTEPSSEIQRPIAFKCDVSAQLLD